MMELKAIEGIDLPRIAWRAVSFAPFPGDLPEFLGDENKSQSQS